MDSNKTALSYYADTTWIQQQTAPPLLTKTLKPDISRDSPRGEYNRGLFIDSHTVSLIIWLTISTNQKVFYVTKYLIGCCVDQ